MQKFSGNKTGKFAAPVFQMVKGLFEIVDVFFDEDEKPAMKGGHRHRRNYWFCPMCGKAIKAGKFQAKNNIAMVHKTVRHMETVHQMPF